MRTTNGITAVLLTSVLSLITPSAFASLIASGSINGGALLTDTATNLQWLSPVATSGQSFNSVAGGFDNLVTQDGFQFATVAQVESMFQQNFDPTNSVPIVNYDTGLYDQYNGVAAAVPYIQSFFNTFGITEQVTCLGTTPPGACPRTAGFTASLGNATDTRTSIGFITLGNGAEGFGYTSSAPITSSGDPQLGSYLVRVASVPEPATYTILMAGLGLMGFTLRKKQNLG